jgi:DNA-binding response OmpR family regulator
VKVGTEEAARLNRPVVLVVEDDPDLREAVRWLLEDEGWLVETAADGRQALDRAAEVQPALVVLDLGLPIFSGEEVADRLREMFDKPPPIIVMSAAGMIVEKTRRIQPVAWVPKPFDLDELAQAVRVQLDRAG